MLNVVVASLVWGCQLALVTMAFNQSYAVVGFANFAIFEFVTIGAAVGRWGNSELGLPFALAVALAMVVTALIATLLNIGVFGPMRETSIASKMLASVGIAIVARQVVQLVFGAEAQFFDVMPTFYEIGPARISSAQILVVALTFVVMIVFGATMALTNAGRVLRATADDPQLSETRGINTGRVLGWAWVVSGAFAALGGVLLGSETFVRPSLGLTVLLPVLAAATLGGLGSAAGAVVGGLAVALAQNLVLYINWGAIFGGDFHVSSTYKSSVALCVLVVVLLIRPTGLIPGREARRG